MRNPCLFPCSLMPVIDAVFDSGINRYTGNLIKSSRNYGFCKAASLPLVHYQGQPRQTGSLYICRLIPMAQCTYQILMDIKADDAHSFVELNTPASKLIIQETNNRILLKSYFESSCGNIESKTLFLGNSLEKLDFEITFDGCSRTNTVSTKDGECIITPFYDLERQMLPYVDFSNGYLRFTSFLSEKGTCLDINIYSIKQIAGRKFITALGSSKMTPFGVDGPHIRSTTEQGIGYLSSKNNRGTIWFDIDLLGQFSESDLEYLRNLVVNNLWDTGVHYSKELNSLPLDQAYTLMDEGYQYVYEKIGRKPTSWCSLRNRDNITHAIYAYGNLGMFWRNGNAGIHAENYVGGLCDDTWEWWEPASKAGISYPVFSHQLDVDPAIKYSISRSKFRDWVDNYYSNNMTIIPFYEYNQMNCNTYDASFENLQHSEKLLAFDAHTNGADALVNVNITAEDSTQVYDVALEKYLDYEIEQDRSITFRVADNHSYEVYLNGME
ncbi:MAG TPA: hypothetical protein HA306_04200 [Methanosarcina sp.]|nr:hypothetical protein [Methanosarcina sp.]